MIPRIQRLTKEVASQIAAGEVIERPVSVVKELLENALDAKATSIVIEILDAGLQLIRVTDNGIGILANDLALAIEPHATSKIRSLDDLYQTLSKGFRGEALASIASVSRFKITSRPQDQAHAVCLSYAENGISTQTCVHAQGTEIEVKDLFYNLPVRKKFLKSTQYEWQAIEALVKRFALSAPWVAIKLYHHQQLVLDLPQALVVQEHLYRARKIWGQNFAEQAKFFAIERSGLKIWGWLTQNTEHRSQNDRLWTFLNGRIIHDRLLHQALKQAYTSGLPEGRHPQVLLYFELPLNMVDVNVHPAKHEVRFEQPRLIFDFIVSSLKAYWQASPISQPFANPSATSLPQVPPRADLSHQMVICNADYLLVSYSQQIFYMIDVQAWWEFHFQQVLARKPMPWPSRVLAMPILKHIAKIALEHHETLEQKCQLWGFELQFWGEDRLCIRAVPELFPQINLNTWLQHFKSNMTADDLHISQLFNATQISAYDLDEQDLEDLMHDLALAQSQPTSIIFARCLDPLNCRKLFT